MLVAFSSFSRKMSVPKNAPFITIISLCNVALWVHKVTNSMEQIPSWEANSLSASQEIPRLLRNPNVHCRVHNSTPLVPILTQMNPVRTFTLYFPKIHSDIIPIYARVFQVVTFLQVFRPKSCLYVSSLPCMLHAPPISSSLIWSPW
jgi:hypothetical protein